MRVRFMEFGVSTGLYNDMDTEGAVRHLAEIGWSNVEFGVFHITRAAEGEWRRDLKSLRELCQSLDVKAWQMHCGEFHAVDSIEKRENLEIAFRWIQYCEILDVPYLVFHPIGSDSGKSLKEKEKTLELNIQAFKEIGKFAEDLGVKAAIENAGSIKKISDIKEIINAVGSAGIGICLDTSHINMLSLNVEEAIYESGSLLWATHISDNDGSGDQHRIPYNASYWGKPIDWIKVVKALKKIDYHNLFNLELLGEGMSMVPKGSKWVPGNFAPVFIRDLKLQYAKKVLTWLFSQCEPLR